MGFRIHDSVVRGEIDNREKGVVRGRVWVYGRVEPLVLELSGNAHPDLAGCLLTVTNPLPSTPHPGLDSLHSEQRGTIGDLTASRKVRVFDIPLEEALAMIRRGERPPERLANCLYLEWFSERNGRVVIESTDYQLTLSPPAWRLTPEENTQRAQEAEAGMKDFLGRLTGAIEQPQEGQKDPEAEWDEHDSEKFLKECDARTEKHGELLDKYGDSAEAEEIIAREMGWVEELTPEEAAEQERHIKEINAACEAAPNEPEPPPEPHREGIDWIRTDRGDLRDPLQHRCFESAMKAWKEMQATGLDLSVDSDLERFISEFRITSAKLAGALTGVVEGRGFREPAFTVAYLKRALDHLHQSQAGLESVAAKELLPGSLAAEARTELFAIREGILKLMDEHRGRG